MLMTLDNRKIFIASQPVDFRMSIDSLAKLISRDKNSYLHDGSIYVFYNFDKSKIKCLFWDRNGFVMYYKKLDNTKFMLTRMNNDLTNISAEELQVILAGYDPALVKRHKLLMVGDN
jgi:transposase